MIRRLLRKHYVPILLSLCLVLIFFSNYWFYHANYKYPAHADDWIHVVVAEDITFGRQINPLDPYFNSELMFYPRGFHVLLSEISKMTGLSMLDIARYFPAVFQGMLALSIFLLLKRFDVRAGLFGAFAVIAIKTHVTILGPAFLVPLNFGLILTPIMLWFLLRGYETSKMKYFLLGGLMWFAIFCFHFSSFLIASFIVLLSLSELLFIKDRIKTIKSILPSAMIFTAAIYLFLMSFYKTSLINAVKGLIESSGSIMISPFSPVFLLNYMLVIFAVAGLYHMFTNKKTGSATLILWMVFIFFDLFMYYRGGGWILSYERSVFYATEALLIIGAVGLYTAVKYFDDYPRALRHIPIIVFVFILSLSFYANAERSSKFMYYLIDDGDYAAYTWLGENYGSPKLLENHLRSLALPYFHIKPVQVSPMHAVPIGLFSDFGMTYYDMSADELYARMKKNDVEFVINVPGSDRFEVVYNKGPIISKVKT